MTNWIKCSDKFPEYGVWVLVRCPHIFEGDINMGINVYSKTNGWEIKTTDEYAVGITHWQCLPEDPEEEWIMKNLKN